LREIILDTETTGLDPTDGHRVVEIGAVELMHHVPTGRQVHFFINPERAMPTDALNVHGLTDAFLTGQPVFADICTSFLEFLGDASLVMHNAAFDLAFLNAELDRLGKPRISAERIIDSLELARSRHPMAANSLDALCKRYDIDLSRRDKHGALLDAQLLAEVYIELIGGKQPTLVLMESRRGEDYRADGWTPARQRPAPLPSRVSEAEKLAHRAFILTLGARSLWLDPAVTAA
jgi:DNA polymerase-3 subunit epsilon